MSRDLGRFQHPLFHDWVGLQQGQSVMLRTDSPLHTGVYECRVLAVEETKLRISMPMEKGKLVLVPVGTSVYLEAATDDGQRGAEAVVVDRRGGADRSLMVRLRSELEQEAAEARKSASSRTIAVTSGKGGVGKSAFVINLGAALVELGLRVCIIDVDLGTANVDVLLNLTPHYNLAHVVHGQKTIFDVLVEGPAGLIVLPGGSGLQELTELTEGQFEQLHSQFKLLEQYADVVLLDTGSGLARPVTRFVVAADETVVVTTPEPHAIVDAYALIKVAAELGLPLNLRLVVNRVHDALEAETVAGKMLFAGERFLNTKMDYLGHIVDDAAVARSVRQQQTLLSTEPHSEAAANMRQIARTLATSVTEADTGTEQGLHIGGRPRSLLQRIRMLFSR